MSMAHIEVKVCSDDNLIELNEEEVQDGANPSVGIEEVGIEEEELNREDEDEVIDTLMIKYEEFVNGNKSTVKDVKVTSDTHVELLTEKCMQLMHGLIRDYKHLSAQITQYDRVASESDAAQVLRRNSTAMTEEKKCEDEKVSKKEPGIDISRYNQYIRKKEKGDQDIDRQEEDKYRYTRLNQNISGEGAYKSKILQRDKDISEHEDCATASSLHNQGNSDNDKTHNLEYKQGISENKEVLRDNLAYNQGIIEYFEGKPELAQYMQNISENQEDKTDISQYKQDLSKNQDGKTDISQYMQNISENRESKTDISQYTQDISENPERGTDISLYNQNIIEIEKHKIDITQYKLDISEIQEDTHEHVEHNQDIVEQEEVKTKHTQYNQGTSEKQEIKTDISLRSQGISISEKSKTDISKYKQNTNEDKCVTAFITQYNKYISENKKKKKNITQYNKKDNRKIQEDKNEDISYNQDTTEHQEIKPKIYRYNEHTDEKESGYSEISLYNRGVSGNEDYSTEFSRYNENISDNENGTSQISRYNRDISEDHSIEIPRYSNENESQYIQISRYNGDIIDNKEYRTQISKYNQNIGENELGRREMSRYNRDINGNERHRTEIWQHNRDIDDNMLVDIEISRYRDIIDDKDHRAEISYYNRDISEGESGNIQISQYNRDINDNSNTEISRYNQNIVEIESGNSQMSRYDGEISDNEEHRMPRYDGEISENEEHRILISQYNRYISKNKSDDGHTSRYNQDIGDNAKHRTEMSQYNQNINENESERHQISRYNQDISEDEERGREMSRYDENINESDRTEDVKSDESDILYNGTLFPHSYHEENVMTDMIDFHSEVDTFGVSPSQLDNCEKQLLYAGANELCINIPTTNGSRVLDWLPRNNTDFTTTMSQDNKYQHTNVTFSHHKSESPRVVKSIYSSGSSDKSACLFMDDDKMSGQGKNEENLEVSVANDLSTFSIERKSSRCEEEDEEEIEEVKVRKIKEIERKEIILINEPATCEVIGTCYEAGKQTATKPEIGRQKENSHVKGNKMLSALEYHWNSIQEVNYNVYRDREESSPTDSTQTTVNSGNINLKYYSDETDYEENLSDVSDRDAWTTYTVNNDEEENVVENYDLHTIETNILYPSDVSENEDTDTSDIILVTPNIADSNIDPEILILSRHKKDVIDIINQSGRLLEKNKNVIFMSKSDVDDILEEVDVETCGNVQVVTRNITHYDETLLQRDATTRSNKNRVHKYYDNDYNEDSVESRIQMNDVGSVKRHTGSVDTDEREYKRKVEQLGYIRDDLLTYTYNKYNMRKFKKDRSNTSHGRKDRHITTRFTYTEPLDTSDEGYPVQFSGLSSSTSSSTSSEQYLTASSSLEDIEYSPVYRPPSYKSFF